MAEYFITLEGKKQLEKRLEELKVNGRAEMAERIREAREFGDLSENAEYDIAKDEQAKMEAEILEIETTLRLSQIIDEKKIKNDKVNIGSTVEFLDMLANKKMTYKIVGTHESNPFENRISNESPVGKALLGKKKGDEVAVNNMKLQILKIS